MSQHQPVILHVTLNTGDQAPQPASVLEAGTEELLGPLVAELLPASDGIPRQRPLPVPLEQYTVQALARDAATPLFRVYAPPPAPIPAQGTELAALVSFGVAVRRGPEAAALWASLHDLAGPAGAHPGGLAADGCHYCRTTCATWGEVEGERHCHGDRQKSRAGQNGRAPVLPALARQCESVAPKRTRWYSRNSVLLLN